MADPIPDEQVYLDAATAYVRADGVNDGYVEGMIHDKPFRAAVDSAYRAGLRQFRQSLPPADVIARRFHETYERLAPDFDYRTREASAKPWADVPEQNKALMIRTALYVRGWLIDAASVPEADGEERHG
jgi:hypothetical protein